MTIELKNRTPLALTAAALVALTGRAAPSVAVAKDRFVAGIQITEWLALGPSEGCTIDASFPTVALGQITGAGLGTVIGSFTLSSVDCVRSASPWFAPPYTFSSTNFVLTAANGDRITATYGGTAEQPSPGVLVLKGTFTFTSGTGEFSKVKGSGTLQGVQDVSTFPATGYVSLSGTISR